MRIISNVQDVNSYSQENHFAQKSVTITTAHGRVFIAVSALKSIVADYDKAEKGRSPQPVRSWEGLPSIAATASVPTLDPGASEPEPEAPKEKTIKQVEED